LRLFRKGKARSEERQMDEHIVLLDGKAEELKNDFIDDNKKNLEAWIERQNRYSSREADQILNPQKAGEKAERLGGPATDRRKMKNFYLKMPLFWRSFFYFIYRYFFRLGFLDGKEGLIFHFLQGFWYRFLADAKVYEAEKKLENKKI
ncbi:MAG: glycosyltransferase family 2 protein, partial [Patescibacteria group bacterium]